MFFLTAYGTVKPVRVAPLEVVACLLGLSHVDYIKYLKSKDVTLEKKVSWAGGYLEKKLGDGYKIIRPRMPLQDYAKYGEWKILFEKYLPLLNERFILIGSSLGGIFLAKYLSENKLSKNALSAYLVGPPFDDTLPNEDLVGGFDLKSNFSLIEKNCKKIYVLFSQDDNVVPISHANKYKKKIKTANVVLYKSKNGHFDIETFPEIIKYIKSDVKDFADS